MFPRGGVLLKEMLLVLRGLRRDRAYTVVSIVLLAIGIGLSSAVFTLLWQAIYASLPVPHPNELYTLHTNVNHNGRAESDADATVFSAPTYRYLAAHFTSAGVAARHGERINVETPQGPEHLLADFVSGNFFDVIGLKPALGLRIRPQNDMLTGDRFVAVISYDLWQEAFGGQLSALNSSIRLNGIRFRIIGIAPRHFTGFVAGQAPQAYLPLIVYSALNPGWNKFDEWSFRWLNVFTRLPGAMTHARAEAAIQPVYQAAVREELAAGPPSPGYLRQLSHERLTLLPSSQGIHAMLDEWGQPLRILQWMTLAVLLLVSLNVAGLTVIRALRQRHEVLVRYALGASRAALMRLYLMQTLALAFAGGIAAPWISRWSAALLLHLAGMDRTGAMSSHQEGYALVFDAAAVIGVGLLIGFFPALSAARVDVAAGLNEVAGTHSVSRSHVFARRGLAAAQIALSLVLVVAAGLFAKSLHTLITTPLGFNANHLTLFSIDPKLSSTTVESAQLLYSRIDQRLREIPGIASVSYGTGGPFPKGMDVALITPGTNIEGPGQRVGIRSVIGPDYFHTLGISVIAGREFDQRDRGNGDNGLIISQNLAKQLFGGRNPIGQTVAMFNGVDPNWLATIVGVVAGPHLSWKRADSSLIYTAAQQLPHLSEMTFYIRILPGFTVTSEQLRSAVRKEMPALSAYDLQPMTARMEQSASAERAMTFLTTIFAGLAFLIAVVGIYGVVAHTSSLRTVEFGVRISVGASPYHIAGLILRDAAFVVGCGLLLAAPLAWFAMLLIRSQLYGITINQPLIYAGAVALLIAASIVAALVPARRAAKLDPLRALRYE